jgi:hypothetical protein
MTFAKIVSQEKFNQLNALREGQKNNPRVGEEKTKLQYQISKVHTERYPEFDSLFLVEAWGDIRIKAIEAKTSVDELEQSGHHAYFKKIEDAEQYVKEVKKILGGKTIGEILNELGYSRSFDLALSYTRDTLGKIESLIDAIAKVKNFNRILENRGLPILDIVVKHSTYSSKEVYVADTRAVIKLNVDEIGAKENIDSVWAKLLQIRDAQREIDNALEDVI